MSTDPQPRGGESSQPTPNPDTLFGEASPTARPPRSVWPAVQHDFIIALAAALAAFACTMALDWFLLRQERWRPLYTSGISNLIFSALTFVLVLTIARHSQQQRHQVMRRLEVIDEMNHHIRNALQVISFSARPTSRNEWEMAEMKQAVERIHWTLREILPKVEPHFAGFEGSAREKVRDDMEKPEGGEK